MSRAKPIESLPTRALLPLLLLPLVALAGCAHQPGRLGTTAATAVPASAPPPAAAPTAVPATATGTAAAAGTPASAATAATVTPAIATGGDDAGSAGAVSSPPADALVTARPADLFQRIRDGFKLPDPDEGAIDSQVNWFANHPEYVQRTFGRAELWLYYIVSQLEQRNMPTELALLPVIESGFQPYAYSHARAVGLWQFISDTGKRFGLKQDWWYDGRRDPIAATRAALDYLQSLHDEFGGDWLLAIAAYDCGELTVSRAIERNRRRGLPTDFWHLRLPSETRGYVPELLAMRRLVANPGRYGLEISPIRDQPYFTEIDTGGQIDLSVVAQIAGISVDDLYQLNPGFHRWATDPTGPFRLLVPIDAAEGLQQTIAQLTPDERMRVAHYTVERHDSVASIARRFHTTATVIRELNDLGPRQRLVADADLRVPSHAIELPEKVAHAALLADRRAAGFGRRAYRPTIRVVRRGDTLYSIARRLHTTVGTLARLNGIDPHGVLHAGQRLRVNARYAGRRASAGVVATAEAIDTNGVAADAVADGRRMMNYTVRRGDTLYGIARLLQVTVRELLSWNGISRPHDLRPGQVLVAFVKSTGS